MKIMFINPPNLNLIKISNWELKSGDYGQFPPLGLLYVASYLKKNSNHQIHILDTIVEKLDYDEIECRVRDFSPDIVAITTMTPIFADTMVTARIIKKINKNIHICVGGPHTYLFPQQTVKKDEIDSVILGEGEEIFSELVRHIYKGEPLDNIYGLVTKNNIGVSKLKEFGYIKNLDELPFPDRGLLPFKKYHCAVGVEDHVATITSSRGCPYKCRFCDVPQKTYRQRSMSNIMEEIEECLNLGFKEIFFYDDLFNIIPRKVIGISDEILNRGLKFKWSFRGRVNTITEEMLRVAAKAGCDRIHFGVETGTDLGLELLNKGVSIAEIKQAFALAKKAKIRTIADFMIGLPHEKTEKEVLRNVNFVISLEPDYVQFNVFQPYPGTEFFEWGVQKGILHKESWENFVENPTREFDMELWEEHLSKDQMSELLRISYRKFYLRFKYIWQMFRRVRTFTEFKRLIFGAIRLLQ